MAKPDPIPDWLLERVAVDEVPERLRDEVAGQMDADSETGAENRARLAALQDSNREILDATPADDAVREIERRHRLAIAAADAASRSRVRSSTSGSRGWLGLGGALAAAGALAVLALVALPDRDPSPGNDDPVVEPGGETVRLKGDPLLVLHRKRGDQVIKLDRRSVASAGDRIQISYVAAGQKHGVIVSLDGAGVVTLHYPASPTSSTELQAKGPISLQSSYELDDAPDFERFFFVTSREPLDPATIIEQAEELARHRGRDPQRVRSSALALDRNLRQWSFLLEKTDQENNP